MAELTFQRVLSPKDIAAVAFLARGIWHEHYENLLGTGQTAYMLAKFQSEGAISRQILDGDTYKLCLEDGKQIGYYCARRDGNAVLLGRIYLRKEARGKGYARAIVRDVLADDPGCTEIRVAVNEANPSAIAAYGHLGFEEYGNRVTDIGAGYVMHDRLMRMRVPAEAAEELKEITV